MEDLNWNSGCGRNTKDRCPGLDVFHHDRARADHGIFSDSDSRSDNRADADMGARSDGYGASQDRTRSDVSKVADFAIMFDDGA